MYLFDQRERPLHYSQSYTDQSFQSHIIAVPMVATPIEPSATFRCRRALAFDRCAVARNVSDGRAGVA